MEGPGRPESDAAQLFSLIIGAEIPACQRFSRQKRDFPTDFSDSAKSNPPMKNTFVQFLWGAHLSLMGGKGCFLHRIFSLFPCQRTYKVV